MSIRYSVGGYFSGQSGSDVDVVEHVPWLYIIACIGDRLIYVGETYDRGGLIVRLSSHFGPHSGNSTLRKQAASVAGVVSLKSPFVVVAARLPTDDPAVKIDASATKVRRLMEGIVHQRLAMRLPERPGWAIISSIQPSHVSENGDIRESCESIVVQFRSSLDFLEELPQAAPFHFVTLSMSSEKQEEGDFGEVISRIEVTLFEWLLGKLRNEYGAESWWVKGVPLNPRTQCATRKEQEGSVDTPIEAYLTLIDFRDIVRSNWRLFASEMEKIAEFEGKDRATKWIVEINEMRKLWAHPIRQKFRSISSDDRVRAGVILGRLQSVVLQNVPHRPMTLSQSPSPVG